MRHTLKLFTFVVTLLTLVLWVGEASAQVRFSYRDSLGTYKVRFYPNVNSDDAATRYRVPLVSNTTELRFGTAISSYTPLGYANDSTWDNNFNAGTLDDNLIVGNANWLTLGLEGGVWIKEWLYVGGAFVYTAGFRAIRNYYTSVRVGTYNIGSYSLIPMVRFAWLRRGVVQLYSGVGLGLCVAHYHDHGYVSWDSSLAYDVTFIGISVGRKVFGYCDLGAGSRGVLSLGIGYRFWNKK